MKSVLESESQAKMFESHYCRGWKKASQRKWFLSWALENGGLAPEEEGHSRQRSKDMRISGGVRSGANILHDWTVGYWESCCWRGETGGAN